MGTVVDRPPPAGGAAAASPQRVDAGGPGVAPTVTVAAQCPIPGSAASTTTCQAPTGSAPSYTTVGSPGNRRSPTGPMFPAADVAVSAAAMGSVTGWPSSQATSTETLPRPSSRSVNTMPAWPSAGGGSTRMAVRAHASQPDGPAERRGTGLKGVLIETCGCVQPRPVGGR
jgi:hypothetical protein